MNNDELYHYGVPGMRWGIRKGRNQLSKLTGQDKSKISDEKAKKFRGDVATAKTIKSKADRQAWASSNAKQLGGKKYADAVLKQANKENARKFATKTAVGIGVGAVTAVALYPVGKVLLGVNEAIWELASK